MPSRAESRPSRAGAKCRHSRVIAWAPDPPWCGPLRLGSNRSLTVAARIRARFGAATVRERSISLMPFHLPVQRPAGAVRAFEIVVGLGRIGHAPGGRVVG